MDCIRENLEFIEKNNLSKYATISSKSKGRVYSEKECDYRSCFQRDRDRIIHCNSFRRLKYKTQVFISPNLDHYRTRLTHTLEVSQIARTICRALRLNEDLVEAIGLGHDLGHAPFGHAGERALNAISTESFVHAEQSVRVVTVVENNYKGLNLTYEVIEGIGSHSFKKSKTLEGQVLKFADKIAYINHDIEDAIRAGILSINDIPKYCIDILGKTKSERITTIISSVIKNSMEKSKIDICNSVLEAHNLLKKFMFENIYRSKMFIQEEEKINDVIFKLYTYFYKNIDILPDKFKDIAYKESKDRGICDFIAGMTDRYALNLYKKIFIPKIFIEFDR